VCSSDLHFDPSFDLSELGLRARLSLISTARLYLDQSRAHEAGLHLGFAAVVDDLIEPAVAAMARVLSDL